MSRFSSTWLQLREPLDLESRCSELPATLAHLHNPNASRIQVTDLGAGTGANLRYLAPRLGGFQDWLLVDRDSSLLNNINEDMEVWARAIGAHTTRYERELAIHASGFECRVQQMCCDLVSDFARIALPAGGLVSASALLDLVSKDWLEILTARCAKANAPVCFALNYNGCIEWSPSEPEDVEVRDLINEHQRTDKGFGPALGPAAPQEIARVLADCGYLVRSARSDWHVRSERRELQQMLVENWFSAACEIAPERKRALKEWSDRRYDHIEGDSSELVVGHTDIIGWRGNQDSGEV